MQNEEKVRNKDSSARQRRTSLSLSTSSLLLFSSTSTVDTEEPELSSIFIERARHDWIATRLAFRAKCFRKLSDIVR